MVAIGWDKKTGEIWILEKGSRQSNRSIVEIGKNTEKSLAHLKRLAVT